MVIICMLSLTCALFINSDLGGTNFSLKSIFNNYVFNI